MLNIIEQNPKNADFKASILKGFSNPQKSISSEWFYDSIGSSIFDVITKLPEYYPTRTEMEIFQLHITDMTQKMGPHIDLVEYGSGSSEKTRILLDRHKGVKRYIPIEISQAYLTASTMRLRQDYPDLDIVPKIGSFLDPHSFPALEPQRRRIGFFPGSTVGNLSDTQIANFFTLARQGLGETSSLIIGIDIRKSPKISLPAYNDNIGITAAFNLNLLSRINRELGANFHLENFKHDAIWNDENSRIEMHLICQKNHIVLIDNTAISFKKDETILTEISRKFPGGYLNELASKHGWKTKSTWKDSRGWFQLIQFDAV